MVDSVSTEKAILPNVFFGIDDANDEN